MKPFKMNIFAFKANSLAASELLNALGVKKFILDSYKTRDGESGSISINTELVSEVKYVKFIDSESSSLSHVGMSCTEKEAQEYVDFFKKRGIKIYREQYSHSHTHAGATGWHDIIFDTKEILGFNLEVSVRREDK